jgi:hypothetical protein
MACAIEWHCVSMIVLTQRAAPQAGVALQFLYETKLAPMRHLPDTRQRRRCWGKHPGSNPGFARIRTRDHTLTSHRGYERAIND